MPSDATVQSTGKPGAPKGKNVKGKPLGIPMWGWIAGAAIGLIIGYLIVKKSGSSSASSDTGTGPSPLGGSNSGSGGGVVASPPPDLITAAAGGNDQPMANDNTSDSSTTPSQDFFAATSPSSPFQVAPNNPAYFSTTSEPSAFQPLGAGGYAVQTALASGAGSYVAPAPSIIANPTPPTGNISPYSPNLPRHALNIAAG